MQCEYSKLSQLFLNSDWLLAANYFILLLILSSPIYLSHQHIDFNLSCEILDVRSDRKFGVRVHSHCDTSRYGSNRVGYHIGYMLIEDSYTNAVSADSVEKNACSVDIVGYTQDTGGQLN